MQRLTDPGGGRAFSRLRGVDQGRSPKAPRPAADAGGTGTTSIQPARPASAAGRGAGKNNGLGEAFSGSSPATAERRGMMVSRVSPTALRIGSDNHRRCSGASQHDHRAGRRTGDFRLRGVDQGRSPRPHDNFCERDLVDSAQPQKLLCGRKEQRPWGSILRVKSGHGGTPQHDGLESQPDRPPDRIESEVRS